MNRRRFLELLGLASVGATVAYSFPSVIVPKNIVVPDFQTVVSVNQPTEITDWLEFYRRQLVAAKEWFAENAPLWNDFEYDQARYLYVAANRATQVTLG